MTFPEIIAPPKPALVVPTPFGLDTIPSHWDARQRARARDLLACQANEPDQCMIAYWTSDAQGRSANGGDLSFVAAPGVVHRVSRGPVPPNCGPGALHAGLEPHRWKGVRVWVVALLGPRGTGESKAWALCREVIGEVYPEESAFDLRVAARLGCKGLHRADLQGADLRGADLQRADLQRADLRGANLYGANLRGADLQGADLQGAYLCGANLYGAYLQGANLQRAYLQRADLYGADLQGAYLQGAYLYGANLYGAYLQGADLYGADLRGADLRGADLQGAIGANTTGATL